MALAAAALAGCPDAVAGGLASPGCGDGGEPAVVSGVEPGPDLRLADGRLVGLAGIDTTGVDASVLRARLSGWLSGRTVRVLPLDTAPDRWGRVRSLVFASGDAGDDAHPVAVGEALLDAGLVRARPGPGLVQCWTGYLRLETAARDAQRGLWADAATGVVAAAEVAALRARIGSFVVVEGRVESLYEGSRLFLRLGPAPAGGMAMSIDRRTALRFAREGSGPAAWLHRRVRVRGLLDDRWGLAIEVTQVEQVELLGP